MSTFLKYRLDIDGIRAISVLAVIFFHADIGCPGGFVGVDIFFVISGYLITGLILKDLEKGQFQILDFWARRVRRILPVLSVVVISCLLAGWFILLPIDFQALGQSVFAQALLASNIYFYAHSGYFSQPAELMPLLHTWSLAVEEQFYLLFPFLLIACSKYPRNVLFFIVLGLGGISFVSSVYCSYFYPSANFYLLPTRAWELLIGALITIIPPRSEAPRWLRELLSWTGLLAIGYAIFFYDRNTRFPGASAILPCGGATLLIWANSQGMTSTGRLLSMRPLVFIGLISYSFYLWHWPALAFTRYLTPLQGSEVIRLALLAASGVLAVLSWKFIETPFRKRSIFKSRKSILCFGGAVAAFLIMAGFAVDRLDGVSFRFSPLALSYANGASEWGFRDEVDLKNAVSGNFIELGSGDKHLPVNLFVWGESHALATLSILDVLCKEHGVRGVAAIRIGIAPVLGIDSPRPNVEEESSAYDSAVIEFIKKNQVKNVLLVARWNVHSSPERIHECLIPTIVALKDTGARVWIMREVPRPGLNVPRLLAVAAMLGIQDPDGAEIPLSSYHKDYSSEEVIFKGIASTDATLLDPAKLFLRPDGNIILAEGDKSLYFDDNHISIAGAKRLRPLFDPIFAGEIKK